jgi:hypothetical protein
MNLQLVLWVVLALLSGRPGFARAKEKLTSAEYYPLQVGTTWEYKKNRETITVKVVKHEKFHGVMCAALETSSGGKVLWTEYVSVGKRGLYRHGGPTSFLKPPDLFLKFPSRKRQSWKTTVKITGKGFKPQVQRSKYTQGPGPEKVTVPAGQYRAITTVVRSLSAKGLLALQTTKSWYAKGVGLVKTETKDPRGTITMELVKFTAGK